MTALFIAATLICFSIFVVFPVNVMTLALPSFQGGGETLYFALFILLYTIVLPIGEEAYFRVFLTKVWRGPTGNLISCISYMLMNFSAYCFVFDTDLARFIFMLLSFLQGLILLEFKHKQNIVFSLMVRIGVSLGILGWLVFVSHSTNITYDVKQPAYLLMSDPHNLFTRTKMILYRNLRPV